MNVDLAVKNAKLVSPRGIVEAGVAVKNGVVVAVAAVRARKSTQASPRLSGAAPRPGQRA
ncbi:MAG: hypothetical protein V1924_07930 [Candidatus Bathyarchaeota archaeon]